MNTRALQVQVLAYPSRLEIITGQAVPVAASCLLRRLGQRRAVTIHAAPSIRRRSAAR